MPARLHDRALDGLTRKLQKRLQAGPLGRDQAIELLAQLGDRPGRTARALLADLRQAGLTSRQLVALARKGLNRDEKADLERLLTVEQVPFSAEARELLEGVLGRAPKAPTTALDVTATSTSLKGTTRANASLEVVNLSAGTRGVQDAFVVSADADGAFAVDPHGQHRLRGGDVVRVRARFEDGTSTGWRDVVASGQDTRPAEVLVNRLDVRLVKGKVELRAKDGELVSQPSATVRLVNLRTGKAKTITLDGDGHLPGKVTLDGRASDSYSVAVSDGVHNADFAKVSGHLTVAGPRQGGLVPTPIMHKDDLNPDGTPKMELRTYPGPFIRDGLSLADIRQGRMSNCYFPAAVASVLRSRPHLLERIMRDNGDGTFSFTFTKLDWATGKKTRSTVTVDADLWTRPDRDTAYYGRGLDPKRAAMELWYPLLEKAYAVWKGGYQVVGEGGVVCDVMEELTGEAAEYIKLTKASNPDTVWKRIIAAVDSGQPFAAGTHGPKGPVHYTNTGVLADHAYTIIGYQTEGSKRYVVMRNPWGDTEPKGNGDDDGVFKLELGRFMHLMADLHSTYPDE